MRRDNNIQSGEQGNRSPGFGLIANHLRTEQRQLVLDLGAAATPNIEFLAQLQCKVYVENLASMLDALNTPRAEDESHNIPTAAEQILSDAGDVCFDVVLAWDLLNYLTPAALGTLVARLRGFSKHGTLLFALMYNSKQIPRTPVIFKVLAEDRLHYGLNGSVLRPQSPYSMSNLKKKMAGFVVERTYLLQNNIQEYVFKFE